MREEIIVYLQESIRKEYRGQNLLLATVLKGLRIDVAEWLIDQSLDKHTFSHDEKTLIVIEAMSSEGMWVS